VTGARYAVSVVGAAPVPVPGPAALAPHAPPTRFDIDVGVPADAPPGPLRVGITATGQGAAPVEQEVAVNLVEHALCRPNELTVEDYRRKHKLLDEELTAGQITREQLNDYLAELWSCVRPH
jgi:hypothetical protein